MSLRSVLTLLRTQFSCATEELLFAQWRSGRLLWRQYYRPAQLHHDDRNLYCDEIPQSAGQVHKLRMGLRHCVRQWRRDIDLRLKRDVVANNLTVVRTETDDALPLPFVQWEHMWGGGPTVGLAIRSSDITNALNEEPLRVSGLKDGVYSVLIDGTSVATFTNDQLADGVNLELPSRLTGRFELGGKVWPLHGGLQEFRVLLPTK